MKKTIKTAKNENRSYAMEIKNRDRRSAKDSHTWQPPTAKTVKEQAEYLKRAAENDGWDI